MGLLDGRKSFKIGLVILIQYRRDVVLEASASARGGLEAVFLAGSASPRPHTVLPQSWLALEGSALPRLRSISQLKSVRPRS